MLGVAHLGLNIIMHLNENVSEKLEEKDVKSLVLDRFSFYNLLLYQGHIYLNSHSIFFLALALLFYPLGWLSISNQCCLMHNTGFILLLGVILFYMNFVAHEVAYFL
ncbi:hypothetical protein ACJX0J_016378 [Zea mays]